MTKIRAVPRQIYNLATILNDLDLDDSPSLCVVIDDHETVINWSHVIDAEMLAIPGFAATEWQYKRTTYEWIPIFSYVGSRPITDFVDHERWINPINGRQNMWVTPKGSPRQNPNSFDI